nr:MAG TPA: hypothetical protein [Bacteriophage sp.]
MNMVYVNTIISEDYNILAGSTLLLVTPREELIFEKYKILYL